MIKLVTYKGGALVMGNTVGVKSTLQGQLRDPGSFGYDDNVA